MNCSPPGSTVHGISQARILKWVVITFSRWSSQTWDRVSCIGRQILYHWATWCYIFFLKWPFYVMLFFVSCYSLCFKVYFVSISIAAAAKSLQSCPTLCDQIDSNLPGSPSLGFSRQEHWSGLPGPPPGDLPDPGIEPVSPEAPVLQAILYRWATREAPAYMHSLAVLLYSFLMSFIALLLWHPEFWILFWDT